MFVGNLSFDLSQSELQSLFATVGEVSDVFLPTDRESGRPRGFAFVSYTDERAAEEAIQKFDGYELKGRQLRVNPAEERRPRPRSFDPGNDPRAGPPPGAFAKPKGSRRSLRRKKRSLS